MFAKAQYVWARFWRAIRRATVWAKLFNARNGWRMLACTYHGALRYSCHVFQACIAEDNEAKRQKRQKVEKEREQRRQKAEEQEEERRRKEEKEERRRRQKRIKEVEWRGKAEEEERSNKEEKQKKDEHDRKESEGSRTGTTRETKRYNLAFNTCRKVNIKISFLHTLQFIHILSVMHAVYRWMYIATQPNMHWKLASQWSYCY